jgi:Ca2+-binding EF-hand superfamily protein
MRGKGTLTAMALALGVAAATPVLALSPQGGSADVNQDNWIDATEAGTASTQGFAAFDKNGDGFIGSDEYMEHGSSWLADLQKKRTEAAKTGADVPARDDAAFAKMDADKDNSLSRSEYMDFAKSQFEAGAGSAGMIGADVYGKTMGTQSFNPANADADMDKSVNSWEAASDAELDFSLRDKNADDMVSKEEWQGQIATVDDKPRWETRFKTLDTDKDGRLSPAEMSAWQSHTSSVGRSTTSGSTEPVGGADSTSKSDASATSGEEGKWSVWTYRRYNFY